MRKIAPTRLVHTVRKHVLLSTMVLSAAFTSMEVAATEPPQNLNYWLILADDVSDDYINPELCPNITKMSQEGIRFRNAWATPKCGPTRSCLMSGRLARQHGVGNNGQQFQLSSNEFLPNKLEDWNMGIFGKYNIPTVKIPISGFDKSVVWEPSSKDSKLHAMEDHRTGSRFFDPAYSIDGKIQNGWGKFAPHIFMDEAVKYADQSKADQKRFFIFNSMVLGHGMRTREYVVPPGREGNAYNSNVREIDCLVKQAMNWVEQDGNTVLIFATDNPTAGEGKQEISERGCKIALAMWAPGIIPAKGDVDQPVQLRDLYDTITQSKVRESVNLWSGILKNNWSRTFNLTDYDDYSIVRKDGWVGIAPTSYASVDNIELYRNGERVDINSWMKKSKARSLSRIIATGY